MTIYFPTLLPTNHSSGYVSGSTSQKVVVPVPFPVPFPVPVPIPVPVPVPVPIPVPVPQHWYRYQPSFDNMTIYFPILLPTHSHSHPQKYTWKSENFVCIIFSAVVNHSNREHVWSGPVGVFCQAIVVKNSHVDTVSAELHRVAPDFVPEGNQGQALPCMQTII